MALDQFHIKSIAYKVHRHGSIFLDIMLPRNLCSGQYPINIRFHGGFLVAGSRNLKDFFPPRHLKHALASSIILVSPDYRLLPESSGKEILEDLEDLWTWIHTDLSNVIASMSDNQISADVSRILVSGESAGGYLAVQLALSHGEAIKAVIASYPMLDLRTAYYNVDYPKQMGAYPQFSHELINNHLVTLPDGSGPSASVTSSRLELMIAIPQRGRLLEFLGHQKDFFPIERLENNPDLALKVPCLWIYHGIEDTEVPISGTRTFMRRLLALNPNAELRYTEFQGADHGLPCEIALQTTGEHLKGIDYIDVALFK